MRSLAFESLDTVHDVDQLRRLWLSFDPADRRDPFIAARAATQASALGANDDARAWLRPLWDRVAELGAEERAAIAVALAGAAAGIGAEWLPRLESAVQALPRDGAIALAAGSALAERGLWGKARALLEQAAGDVDAARRGAAQGLDRASPSWPRRRATRPAPHAATRAPHARRERVALLQSQAQRL